MTSSGTTRDGRPANCGARGGREAMGPYRTTQGMVNSASSVMTDRVISRPAKPAACST